MGAPRIDRLEKNFLINGKLDIHQRFAGNGTAVNTAATTNLYYADRFFSYSEGSTVKNYSVTRSTDVPNGQLRYSVNVACVTGIPSLAANDQVDPMAQRLEGYFFTLANKKAQLVFWFKSNVTGAFPVSFYAALGLRSYVTTFQYSVANVWQRVIIPIEFEDQVNYSLGSAQALRVTIASVGGSNYPTPTPNQWNAGGFKSTVTGSVNWMSTASNFVRIAGLALVEGEDAPDENVFPLAGRNFAEELMLCYRYFEKSYALDTALAAIGGSPYGGISNTAAANNLVVEIAYKTIKRATPVVTYYNPATGAVGTWRDNGGADVTMTGYDQKENALLAASAAATTNGRIFAGHWAADAEL